MNFQKLMTIEKADTYLDVAFRAARTKEKPKLRKKVDKFIVIKTNEYDKVQTVTKSLTSNLNKIVTKFPQVHELPPFYNELLKITLDYDQLKKSLGAVLWASKKIVSFQIQFCSKLKQSGKIEHTISYGKEFYGRVSSVMKQIKKDLEFIEKCRRIMKGFPNIKTSLYTVSLAGYPNVGKSSLLKLLTSSNPEIKNYAFTTKSINTGYFKIDNSKIQVVDTPGAFDRDLKDMNYIEKQAYLTTSMVTNLIVFIIDPTMSCGYSLDLQEKLYERFKKFKKDIILVHSKSDLIEKRDKTIHYVSTKTNEGISELIELTKKHKTKSENENDQE
jgi:nucleolar GTP-binding protein